MTKQTVGSIKIRSVSDPSTKLRVALSQSKGDGSAWGRRLRAGGASASLAEARHFVRRAKAGGPTRAKKSLAWSLLSISFIVSPLAQDRKNPHEGNEEAIRSGMGFFRRSCADCHGMDARGYRAPDLTEVVAGGATDDRLFETIRKGVPGTEMPSSNAQDDEIWKLIAYLRSLGTAGASPGVVGNAENGAKIFKVNCSSCHVVSGVGGRLGPDLSRIGAARSRTALTREIRTPSEYIRPGYEPVTLVTRAGERIRGVRKNEDSFSVQIMDMRERIQGYMKENLREVINEPRSLMSDYPPERLNDRDLNDLIAYLGTLRGDAVARR